MTRKNLILIVLTFIVGVSVWLFQINRDFNETRELLVEEAERSASRRQFNYRAAATPADAGSATTSTPTTEGQSSVASAEQLRLTAELQGLEDQLSQERAGLNEQRLALEQLRARRLELQQRDPASYSTQINATNTQIRTFLDQLNGYQSAAEEINRRVEDELRNRSSQVQFNLEQMDESIRQQENLIRRTQDEIAYWQINGNVTERPLRLQELQIVLENQWAQAELMRQQRLLASGEMLLNAQALRAEKTQVLDEIATEREEVREEIAYLRELAFRLEEAQKQVRSSQNSLGSQILQTQQAVEAQQYRVRVLEEGISQKNQELSVFR